ncbi:MAG: hypothetical protein R2695_14195 [Acidimicrobiales bacterium]
MEKSAMSRLSSRSPEAISMNVTPPSTERVRPPSRSLTSTIPSSAKAGENPIASITLLSVSGPLSTTVHVTPRSVLMCSPLSVPANTVPSFAKFGEITTLAPKSISLPVTSATLRTPVAVQVTPRSSLRRIWLTVAANTMPSRAKSGLSASIRTRSPTLDRSSHVPESPDRFDQKTSPWRVAAQIVWSSA